MDSRDSDGWRDLVNQLAQRSAGAAYVVFSGIPPGFDRSINGQLMTRDRGVCALFLGSTSFQTPSPEARGDLVAQVLIHEVGHLMNLTHGDAYKSGGCSDAVMPTTDRQSQLPEDAWREAIEDAASRGELPLVAPVPTLIYPFGAQCRACLRAAAKDPAWWPWRTPFRGDFNAGSEDRSRALTLSIHRLGRERPIHARHGVDFTLEIRNNSSQPVPMPAHVGPEFGTLVVSSVATAGGEEAFFAPDNYRCPSSQQSRVNEGPWALDDAWSCLRAKGDPILRGVWLAPQVREKSSLPSAAHLAPASWPRCCGRYAGPSRLNHAAPALRCAATGHSPHAVVGFSRPPLKPTSFRPAHDGFQKVVRTA
ncbi:hypothetical protein SAMN05880557_11284 [Pseudacidovorax sp. RU35E]|nr:hypothetical protein SAMN05880557_11284 [Pseudacidovorax sp. RU35E]